MSSMAGKLDALVSMWSQSTAQTPAIELNTNRGDFIGLTPDSGKPGRPFCVRLGTDPIRDRRSGHVRPRQELRETMDLFPTSNGSAILHDPPHTSNNSVSPIRPLRSPRAFPPQQLPTTYTSLTTPLPIDPPHRDMSVCGSGNELEESDEDDPLESAALMQPLRMLTDREEAARLRADGHHGHLQRRTQTPPLAPDLSHRQHAIHDMIGHRPPKRPRRDTHSDHIREKGDLSRSFMDPVALGHCGEERAKQLFQL